MSLTLSHRWEHALLADTIQRASKSCPKCYLGRTHLQKMLYFMKVLGVPMNYGFEIYHYGPFCNSIRDDVEWLVADDVVKDESTDAGKYSNYRPSNTFEELSSQFESKLEAHEATIDTVVSVLCDFTPKYLELLATLDFSFRWVKARGGDGPWKTSTIEKFKKIKNDRFDDKDIESAYGKLVDAKLIDC